jgi:hypothetical protein
MPSFRADGFKLVINTRDEKGHRPHCHVVYGDARVVIRLDETLEAYDSRGMKPKDERRARELVAANFRRLREWWDEKVENQGAQEQQARGEVAKDLS